VYSHIRLNVRFGSRATDSDDFSMQKADRLSKYFDLPRMRALLTHRSGNEYDTRQTQLAFLATLYIESFRGDNV
jgi:hypothetical protein